MKRYETTRYFRDEVLRKRPYLKLDWCIEIVENPVRAEVQADGKIRWVMGERSIMPSQVGTSPQGKEESVKLHYYEETDSLYIDLSHRVSVDSREVVPGVFSTSMTKGTWWGSISITPARFLI